MDEYKKVIAEITKNTSIKSNDIFDYEFSPYKHEFDFLFKFYHEALTINSSYYGINPNLFYFNNFLNINASARKENEYYIITINKGTIVELVKKFKERNDLIINTNNNDFIEFEKELDVSINELMYEKAVHFTFYHEMAHLIQKSDLLNSTLYEVPHISSAFSLRNHILELDADQFSSLCVGTHVVQYAKKIFKNNITPEKFEKLLIIICSSALFYLLSFQSNKTDIYYKEKSHPHPIIRITCIVFHIVGYCLQSLARDGIHLGLNIKDIVNECLKFSNNISSNKFSENLIENYQEQVGKEALEIVEYIKMTQEIASKDYTLSSYKWNLVAKKL